MPFNIGPGELIIILIIALVVLGPGKLPDVASSLGKSVREFRKAATDLQDATKLDAPAPAAPVAQAPVAEAPVSAPNAPAVAPDPAPPAVATPAAPAEPASDPDRP
jgi:TatA/E family protein of Tat protein translocase